ncbi:MAG: ABC transporter ATP-binding protein [Elusimicrobia bacterium]|nr:ABC transporter ATP-binding protein [Elusimicrobiota bacterium]
MIKIINLSKRYGKLQALDNLNLEISPGEIFGFLGPNGAGKTTTVKLLCGLLKPTSGQAIVGGIDIQQQPEEAKKIIGLVPDFPFVYKKLTGHEFLRFIGDLYDVSEEDIANKIPKYLEMFELASWANELIENYSRGMQQKLVMASVLLHEPKVIILDEPLVGLDPKGSRVMKEIFVNLSKRGTTIFMCTHTLEIADHMCNRIGIIQGGKLTNLGTTNELRQQVKQGGNLEDIFLQLTGGSEYADLLKYLE